MPKRVAEYAQGVGVSVSRVLSVAGRIAIDAEGRTLSEGVIRSQARRVLRNIKAIVQ